MMHETTTSLSAADVLKRAREFFSDRVPYNNVFPDKSGADFATFRGQGGEELVVAASAEGGTTRVRGSTQLFDQLIDRFLSTLPPADEVAA